MLTYVCILIGLLLLIKGGDFLIEGSVAIAQRAKLSPMVIGLTVIGFGTSMPELCVSAQAAWMGSSGIALGNVAGSNICNIALILGLTAIIHPIPASRDTLCRNMPFFVFTLVLIMAFACTGTIDRWMGLLMLAIIITQVTLEVRHSRQTAPAKDGRVGESSTALPPSGSITEKPSSPDSQSGQSGYSAPHSTMPLWRAVVMVILSLAAMVWGADLLVSGASSLAMSLGTSLGASQAQMERIIALTIVAIGTSLPELCASIIAARKGETDMAVGNIIGSGTFNILCVVGASSAIAPIHDAWAPFATDYAVQLFFCLLLWLFLRTNRTLQRWEGYVFLCLYVAYIFFIAVSAN